MPTCVEQAAAEQGPVQGREGQNHHGALAALGFVHSAGPGQLQLPQLCPSVHHLPLHHCTSKGKQSSVMLKAMLQIC